jgi:hypothetical protein
MGEALELLARADRNRTGRRGGSLGSGITKPVENLSGLEAHADGDPVPGRTTTKPLEPGKAD